ncbi:MAG: ParB N-terminal domain-containing protein [Crenarchaeota archaeon]|nr:ParB N-terminal domain-containing protein [Thermoproteota archaeon]
MQGKSIGSYNDITAGLPSRLQLSTHRDAYRKLREIIYLLGMKYSGIRYSGVEELDPFSLYATQSVLESDKLGLVLYLVLFNNYDVPIIVVRNNKGEHFIIDGHHRARVHAWLRRKIHAHVIHVPAYRPRITKPICITEVINPPTGTPEKLLPLRHIVNTIFFLERTHGIIARVWREKIPISRLKPTQPSLKTSIVFRIDTSLPILVYDYLGSKYVVDGHKRTCAALATGLKDIDAVVFTLHTYIGLIRASEYIGYNVFNKNYCKS